MASIINITRAGRRLALVVCWAVASLAVARQLPAADVVPSPSDGILVLDAEATPDAVAATPGLYNDVRQALAALATRPDSAWLTLYVRPGVYWVDDPDDPIVRRPEPGSGTPYGMTVRCSRLRMVGLGDRPDDVVFASARGQTQGADGNFTMLRFEGDDIVARGITFGNYCNVDLVYPRNHRLDRPRRADAIVQAQLVHVSGDRVFCDSCRFVSRLNLCPFTGARRTLFRACHFESTDDALAGSAVYVGCHFTFHSSKPWYSTPSWGAVLLDCDIDILTRGTQYFTKAGGAIAVVDTRLHTTHGEPLAVSWSPYDDVNVCYQSGVTLNGEPVAIGVTSERNASAVDQRADITDRRLLDAYKVWIDDEHALYNTPNLLAGDDGWDPLGHRPAIERAERELGVRLLGLPTWLRLSPRHSRLSATGDTVRYGLEPRRWGDYGLMSDATTTQEAGVADAREFVAGVRWSYPTVLSDVGGAGTTQAVLVSANTFPTEARGRVVATCDSGLKALASVGVEPRLVDAPALGSGMDVVVDGRQSVATVDYTLVGATADDASVITWYRSVDMDAASPRSERWVAVRRGTPSQGMKTYRLTAADIGHRLAVSVAPRTIVSRLGTTSDTLRTVRIAARHVGMFATIDRTMSEDFSTLPVGNQPVVAPGLWTFDAYKPADTSPHDWEATTTRDAWYYGEATDGARGRGLVEAVRGARFFYTPVRSKTGDMSVTLRCDPCKTGGQGFGSATGQYMDIYIKFDAASMNGYALRIERSPLYDRAVLFTLVEYRDGTVVPLTSPVASSCYRSTCTITLSASGSKLTATATTDAPPAARPDGVVDDVKLEAQVEPNTYGTVGVQHTGSTGASATMIRDVEVTWRR